MLKAPAWAKHAVPTPRGWQDPNTGELLVSRRLSDRQVDEWHTHKSAQGLAKPQVQPAPAPAPAPKPEPIIEADPVVEEVAPTAEPLIEADPVDHDHASMTKAQLAEHAHAVHGIDLDTSMTKAQMIEELEAQL
tara:strand:- start:13058 stop:13459 length:402 start_codon:yes stop_codon:yes gene_type:complete